MGKTTVTAHKSLPRLDHQPEIQSIYQEFLEDLKVKGFSGEIQQGFSQRLMASTDNSIYQVLPESVILPRCQQDISLALELCKSPKYRAITIAPRGGGTGTNGQSLTSGFVMDLSKHMNRIVNLDLKNETVTVEPGVVLDQLNQELRKSGYFFAPTLSPSSRATLGGMCNTDACGKGSRVYGRTSDHIESLKVVTIGGDATNVERLSKERLEKAKQNGDPFANIYRLVDDIILRNQEEISKLYPDMARFLTGYNLCKTKTQDRGLDLTYLISGSEGTLCVVTELTLKLTKIPTHSELILVKYPTFDDALRGAAELVSFNPHAIETIDDTILNLAQDDIIWHQVAPMFSQEASHVAAINLIEFSASSSNDLEGATSQIKSHLASLGLSNYCTQDRKEIAALWDLRKKGVGLLGNMEGDRRPIPFVEDTAVPPAMLADYIKDFREVLDRHGLQYGMFGHVDVGCLHVRPSLNLREPSDERLLRKISDEVKQLVKKYHGIMWAEHGRGFRSEYTEEFFGANLFKELKAIKTAFDPHNQLNPGKIISPEGHDSIPKIDDVPLRGQKDRAISRSVIDGYRSAINCNGNGACFNVDPNHVMCPSHKITRDRIHSPKGRASLMREWLYQLSQKKVDPSSLGEKIGFNRRTSDYDYSHEVYDGMQGCLSCKACSTQCPIKVDIPELKSRFLEAYHTRYLRPISDYFIAIAEDVHKNIKGPMIAPNNWLMNLGVTKFFLKTFIGLVDAPLLSSPSLSQTISQNQEFKLLPRGKPIEPLNHKSVIVIQDSMTSFYEAPLVLQCLRLIKAIGLEPHVASYMPNGKGQHVKGFRKNFIKTSKKHMTWLKELEKSGAPLISIDPAIALTYREEYKDLLGETVQVWMLHEWLANTLNHIDIPPPRKQKRFALFSHCGEQTSGAGTLKNWQKIFQSFGHELDIISLGCCGMAGAFGHEAKHFNESKGIYELSWSPQIEKMEASNRIPLATGASCRLQVSRFGGKDIKHPFEALYDELAQTP